MFVKKIELISRGDAWTLEGTLKLGPFITGEAEGKVAGNIADYKETIKGTELYVNTIKTFILPVLADSFRYRVFDQEYAAPGTPKGMSFVRLVGVRKKMITPPTTGNKEWSAWEEEGLPPL